MDKVPDHVAIILDGNRRWAKEKKLPTLEGHRSGLERLIQLGKKARQMGIKVVTAWVFSTENWDRSETEKKYLWRLFEQGIKQHLKIAQKEKIRIVHLGRKDRIPVELKKQIERVEEKTKVFNQYYLAIALDYGGRDEILRAVDKMRENFRFKILNSKLDSKTFEKYLDTSILPYPNPDLIIRVGKEKRLSGFMIWQGAYSELIFVDKYMPDFTAKDFEDCIREFACRQRRFGK